MLKILLGRVCSFLNTKYKSKSKSMKISRVTMSEQTKENYPKGEHVSIEAVTLQSTAEELGERVEEARRIIYVEMKWKDRTKNWIKLYACLLLPWFLIMVFAYLFLKFICFDNLQDSSSSFDTPAIDSRSQQVPLMASETDMLLRISRTSPTS